MTPLAFFGIESTGVTVAIDLLIVFGVLLYLTLIYWTYVDARRRLEDPTLVSFATLVSVIPFLGTLLYVIVRPPETLEDARERDLDVETTRLRLHQLESGLCPHCDYPVEPDYVRCPSCLRKLKDRCKSCSRPLDKAWTICPYCETEVPARSGSSRRGSRRGSRSRPALERELASERAGADGDRPETPPSPESAAAQRRRTVSAGEELEPEAAPSGRRGRSRAVASEAASADGHKTEPDPGEPAPVPRQRSERSRPASAPRPGSAY
jgi:Double zinc ribbon